MKQTSTDFLDKLDNFFAKRQKIVLGIVGFLTLFFGLFLFDAKLSVGGDDAAYIVRAIKFLDEGLFPSYQGALYPLFLSLFVGTVGVNVILFKWLSLLATFVWIGLFYKTFKKVLPASVLNISLLVFSVNYFTLYFASQTYNEAFFLAIEMLFVWKFLENFNKINQLESDKKTYKNWAVVGFFLFLVYITKSAGLAVFIAVILFLMYSRKFWSSLYLSVSFMAYVLLYNLIKKLIFSGAGAQLSGQSSILFLKDPYNRSKGNEDLMGFVQRFFDNSHLYLSKHLPKMLGLRPLETYKIEEWITYAVYLVFAGFMFLAIKKKKKSLLFLGLISSVVLSVTFVVLQKRWDQDRLIMLVFPFFTSFLFYGIYEVFKSPKLKKFQIVAAVLMGSIFFMVAGKTWSKAKNNVTVLKRNLAGDKYHGYTTDWKNYLKMCEWAGENYTDSAKIMARKPSLATIFGDNNIFFGLYRLPSANIDTMVQFIKKNEITHVIMANLRKREKIADGNTINTISRALTLYTMKYPYGLKLVHKIGKKEPAYLFELIDPTKLSAQEKVENIKTAMVVNPKSPVYNYNLGNRLIAHKLFNEAIYSYTLSINNNKKNGFEVFFNRGLAYFNLGKFTEAINDFNKTLSINPAYHNATYNIGICYLNSGDKQQAQTYILKSQQEGHTVPAAVFAQLNN